jgi:GNAT superfamily N-acetyltransferase
MIEVRPTRPDEWERMRRLRHAALTDAPTAFAETLAESEALAEEVWRHRAKPNDHQLTLVATDGESAVGMCAVIRDSGPDQARLVAVWVDPAHRGQGVAASLIEAAIAWCERQRVGHLTTAVNETNLSAAAAYRRAGFAETGGRKPIPNHPGHFEIDLSLPIGSDR